VTGEGTRGEKTHNVNHKTTSSVISSVAYDARVKNQITGFNLKGFGAITSSGGDIPVVGAPCPGNQGTDATWSSVTAGDTTGGLFVNYGGTAVALPNTPVVTTTI
jgi:hypothetical protein